MADGARVTPSGQSSPAINRKAVPTTKYESEHSSSSLLPKVQDERFTAKSPVSWLRAWWLELTASLFAIACLAANLAILLTINGKPLRSWEVASVSITPNTLISIFSTLAKSSMLLPITEGIGQLKWTFFYQQPHRLRLLQTFDDASRGPLGALDLLWKVNVGAIAASCGAILTVLSLAFDPFTQQILAYPTNVVQAHNYSTPKIPVTEMFTWADKVEYGALQGLFAPVAQIIPYCPKGNCTWPEYSTLGICNQCVDLSADMKHDCRSSSNGTDLHCTFETNDGVYFTMDYSSIAARNTNSSINGTTSWQLSNSFAPIIVQVSEYFGGQLSSEGVFVNVSFLWSPQILALSGSGLLPSPVITECSLLACEQTYGESHFQGSNFEHKEMSFQPLMFNDTDGAFFNPVRPYVGKPAHAGNDTKYIVTPEASNLLATSIGQAFIPAIGTFSEPLSQQLMYPLDHFFEKNLTLMMDSVARGMSQQLRNDANATVIEGVTWLPLVFVDVRWAWFAYSVALVFLAVAFLVITVVFSCENDRKVVWKSSALALLFHGLQASQREHLLVRDVREMEHAADKIDVHLVSDDEGDVCFARCA